MSKNSLIHIKVLYTLNKALTLTLFILFLFLNASHGPLKWFLKKSCPRSIMLLLFQLHDYLLSFQLNPLLNPNFNNSLPWAAGTRHHLPPALSSLPSFSSLDSMGHHYILNSQPSPPSSTFSCSVIPTNCTLLHTCTDAANNITMITFLNLNSQPQILTRLLEIPRNLTTVS